MGELQPYLSREEVRRIDRHAIEVLGVPGIVLMENAARAVLDQAMAMLGKSTNVCIVCGAGNNGGDGYALARLMDAIGLSVSIIAEKSIKALSGDARINADIAQKLGLRFVDRIPQETQLVVDALFGTGLTSPPRPAQAERIREMNDHPAPVLSIDLPSGLDCDTGEPLDPDACVQANATVTFVARKRGMSNPRSTDYTGQVIVRHIGLRTDL